MVTTVTNISFKIRDEYQRFLEPTQKLLESLVPVIPIPTDAGNVQLIMMPQEMIGETANQVLQLLAYQPGNTVQGLVLPAERPGAGYLVLIDEELLLGFEDPTLMLGLYSVFLEEFIHVAIYACRHRNGGLEHQVGSWTDMTAERLHDEYAASRVKSDLLTNYSPFIDPETRETVPVIIERPESLDSNLAIIEEMVEWAQSPETNHTNVDMLAVTGNAVFRYMLEPFARDFGLWDGRLPGVTPGPAYSPKWVRYMGKDWDAVLALLRASHDSEYAKSADIIRSIKPHVAEITERLWLDLRGDLPESPTSHETLRDGA